MNNQINLINSIISALQAYIAAELHDNALPALPATEPASTDAFWTGRRPLKRHLTELLSDTRFKWRSLEALAEKTGNEEGFLEKFLSEWDEVRRAENTGKELWGLKSRVDASEEEEEDVEDEQFTEDDTPFTTAAAVFASQFGGALDALLRDPRWNWRKVSTLAEETGTSVPFVMEFIRANPGKYVVSGGLCRLTSRAA